MVVVDRRWICSAAGGGGVVLVRAGGARFRGRGLKPSVAKEQLRHALLINVI